MNSLNSRQRKIVYALAILVLLVPIIYLGAPLSSDVVPGQKTSVSGGALAQLRHEYELGESTLGDIDPSSAAANLVLLGLRGMAATVLHQNALEQQDRKEWGRLKSTVESILKLQPHYEEVWKFQGWNLAFNVSREWDQVADRFYWVKEGLKFLNKGAQRNRTSAFLKHNVGDFVGRKIGTSDESQFFRRYFVKDPDTSEFDGPDPETNPEGRDNYLVAYDHFLGANARDDIYPVKGMAPEIFRKAPGQALFDYAGAITKEGKFELARAAWEDAHRVWTEGFGNEVFMGLNDIAYKLNSTEAEILEMASQNGVSPDLQRDTVDRRSKMLNYTFWRDVSECERDPLTVQARKAVAAGKRMYAEGEISDSIDADGVTVSPAQRNFEKGIALWADVFAKYPAMTIQDDMVLHAMLAVHYWKEICKNNGRIPPEEFPLADFVAEKGRYMGEVLVMFNREIN